MSAIELNRVNYSYGKRRALSDLSFSVQPRTMTALLGPNGGGKTTLFRILSTLIVPDSGTAVIGGSNTVEDPFGVRRQIGIVFQSNSLDHELSAYENLIHQGHLYGLKGSGLKARAGELLEKFNLSDRSGDLVKTLSGGLQRRVELAKALLHQPFILLLDEPTTGLDPNAKREFWSYLKTLKRKEGITILLTTHYLDEAEICDHLVILDQGKLVAEGSADSLKKEIGTEVVVIHSSDSDSLAVSIQSDYGFQVEAVDNLIRIERDDGHLLIGQLVEKYGDRIDSIAVSKPTLEDVFIRKTGHSFEENPNLAY